MSSEESFLYEDSGYLSRSIEKHSSIFKEGQLEKKCLSALLLTAKKYVASLKFSLFQDNFMEIHQRHPDALKDLHNQLQVQLVERLKEIMLKLYIKHNISYQLSSLDDMVMNNKNAWNKNNESGCPLTLNSTHCSSYPINKIQTKVKNQRLWADKRPAAKQATKAPKYISAAARSGQNRSSSLKQSLLKPPTCIMRNKYKKRSPTLPQKSKSYWEKQRLNSILSQLSSCNEEEENRVFRNHEGILILGNRILDLHNRVMVELDKVYERHIFRKNI